MVSRNVVYLIFNSAEARINHRVLLCWIYRQVIINLSPIFFSYLGTVDIRAMFDPRFPVEFKKPVEHKEEPPKYTGISQYASLFEKTAPPPVVPFETPAERKKNRREQLMKLHDEKNELLANDWDPHSNPKATENAYSTLFIGRLSYETTEKKLRREVEAYGTIRNLRVVHDTEGKPRGYAFIEFENEADMTAAYRKLEGRKIDGRRIVCDVERGR